jgi:hypothetical protein
MNQREMKLLEKAFIAEFEEGAHGAIGIMQTKSKVAAKLVEDGYLVKDKMVIAGRFPVTIEGYRLTHLGRLTYCTGC